MISLFEWKENLSAAEWDTALAALKGHPLQSALWGDARKQVDGIQDTRWAAFKDGQPVYLVRFETRRVLKFINIAWTPRGPTSLDAQYELLLQKEFLQRLHQRGFSLCVINRWQKILPHKKTEAFVSTIWVNLTLGKERLWSNLHKQCRNDVRRAKKKGVSIERVSSQEDVHAFYQLCQATSRNKKFHLNTSEELMSQLLKNEQQAVESNLFIARYEGQLCGGAFILRSGENVHYLWGATDRQFARLSIGEALQWEVIEWALNQNCKKYDLEGIDEKKNSGTYHFKKKLGGEVVALPSVQFEILNKRIKMLTGFFRINTFFLLLLRVRCILQIV
jgi:hypothetical protein